MNIWYREQKVEDNLICDICGYQHDTPDHWSIVIKDFDGVLRCKVCRGDGKFNGVQKRRDRVKDATKNESP